MSTPPTPADMPRAGLARAEILLPRAPSGALEQLAAEQRIGPVTDPEQLAAPEPIPDDEAEALEAALHKPRPQPPRYPTMPVVTRDQHIRRLGLELALKFYADDPQDRTDRDVLGTAQDFSRYIRSGHLPDPTDDHTDQP